MTNPSDLTRADAAMPIGPGREAEAVAVRAGLAALLVVLVATAAILAARRILGALVAPLPSPILAATGVALAMLALAVRTISNRAPHLGRAGKGRMPIRAVTSLAVFATALSLSVPGSGGLGLACLWLAIVAGETVSWRAVRIPRPGWPVRFRRRPNGSRRTTPPEPIETTQSPAPKIARVEPADDLASEVIQQLTRRHLADGTEELSGWLRVSFAPGQRTENVHVAFCPPFPAPPQLAVSQLDGPAARTKTAQLLPYGARIDLKFSGPADTDTSVLLKFSARTGGS